MYQINTGQARTDLYGIGKGEAQLIDLSIMRDKEKAAKEKHDKQVEARNVYAGNLMKSAYTKGVLPAEQKYFAEQAEVIKNDLIKKIGTKGELSVPDILDFESRVGDLGQRGELSKQYKEEMDKLNMEVAKNPNKYNKRDIAAAQAAYNRVNPADVGTNYNPVLLREYSNYMDRVIGPLTNEVKELQTKDGLKTTFTLPEAEDFVWKDISSDPIKLRNLQEDFEDAKDKMGAKNAKEWAMKMYAPVLVRNDREPYRGASGSGAPSSTTPKIRAVAQGDGNYNVHFQSKPIQVTRPEGIKKGVVSSVKTAPDGTFISATFEPFKDEASIAKMEVQKQKIKDIEAENTKRDIAYKDAVRDYIVAIGKSNFDEMQKLIKEGKLSYADAEEKYNPNKEKSKKMPNRADSQYSKLPLPKLDVELSKPEVITDMDELSDLQNQLGVTSEELGGYIRGGKNIKNKQVSYEHVGSGSGSNKPKLDY